MPKTRRSSEVHAAQVSKEQFDEILRDVKGLSPNDLDEMAVPTYTHRNPLARWIFWRRHSEILRLAGLGRNETVLDFGTGTGALLPSLCAQSSSVYATDIRDKIAQTLVQKLALPVIFHDPHKLDSQITDESLDVIIAADVLEHIEEPELTEYFRMFHRKLSPLGRFILSIPTETALYKLGRVMAGYGGKGEYHRTGIKELRQAAKATGFVESDSASVPLPGPARLFHIALNRKAS